MGTQTYGVMLRLNPHRKLPRIITTYDEETQVWVACDPVTTVYGAGSTKYEAIADYVDDLFYQASSLRDERDVLGGPLLEEYHILRGLFSDLPMPNKGDGDA